MHAVFLNKCVTLLITKMCAVTLHICCPGGYEGAVQPYNKMFYVLPLQFGYGLRAGRSEWIIADTPIVDEMRHRMDKDPLSLGQFQDDSIVLGQDDGGFLAVYHAERFSVTMTCICQ